MRRLSGFDCLTSHRNDAAIQALTSADREATARSFAECGPDIATLIASGDPETVARRLLADRQAKVEQGVVVGQLLHLLPASLGA